MTTARVQSELPLCLADWLAGEPVWSLGDRLWLIERLAVQVGLLHQSGRTHQDVRADQVSVDGDLQSHLGPPAGSRRFGGEESDPEFCPPDLAGRDALELPADIEAATAILRLRGHVLDRVASTSTSLVSCCTACYG